MKKNSKKSILITGFTLSIIILLFGFVKLFSSNFSEEYYFKFKQEVILSNFKYALFQDGICSITDPGWQIYKVDKKIDLKEFKIPCEVDTTSLGKKFDGVELILSNYSEDGSDAYNAKIKIVDDKYLLFVRGGNYYGLYDLQNNETLVNEWSPYRIKDQVHQKIDEIIRK